MRFVLAAVSVAVAVGLSAGCTDTPQAPEVSLSDRLEVARTALVQPGGLTLTLSSTDVPSDADGVSAAQGQGLVDPDAPAFSGTVDATVAGISGSVEIIAIADRAWIKLFTPDFEVADLDALNAPNPATFFDPDAGLAAFLPATTDLAAGQRRRLGDQILDQITGTLPGSLVHDLLRLGADDRSYDVTYGVDADGALRLAVIDGEFFDGAQSTYTLVIDDYGMAVDITAP